MSLAARIDSAGYSAGLRWLKSRGFESRYVTTPYGRLHCVELDGQGVGPPVLLLHGISADGLSFSRVMQCMRPHHSRIVALEALGHGLSDSPAPFNTNILLTALRDAIDALEFSEPPILFGNSMGGGMAMWYAVEYPTNIQGLVVASPAGAPLSDDEFNDLVESLTLRSFDDGRRFIRRIFYQSHWAAWPMAFLIRARFERRIVRDILADIPNSPTMSRTGMTRLIMPVHVLWGEADGVLPAHFAQFYQTNIPPHAVFEWVPRVGHSPHLEAPHRLARVIRDIVNRPNGLEPIPLDLD